MRGVGATRDQTADDVRLIVLSGEAVGRTFAVSEREVVVGRGDEADLRVMDEGVSRRHARLWFDGAHWIEDLGSRNGTLVNGQPARRRQLQVGDRIQLGAKVVLLFTRVDPAERLLQDHERLEATSKLAAGIAHDFNNLLGVVVACLDGLRELGPTEELERKECIEDATSAANQAAALARRLMGLGTPQQHRDVTLDVGAEVTEAIPLIRRALGTEAIALDVQASPGAKIRATSDELHQVLMNLVINARDAMPEGGVIGIEVARVTRRIDPSPGATWVQLTVRDDGVGMDAETRARIFEPFFTTKRRKGGNGLGLATVFNLVRGRGGHVEVESELGAGTTFRVLIPAAERRPKQTVQELSHVRQKVPTPRLRPRGVPPQILLVHDDLLVARARARMLRRIGRVDTVRSGEEALARLRESPPIDAMLLDLELVDDDGLEVLEAVRIERPELPVIVCSGGPAARDARRLEALGTAELLVEPIGGEALRAAVRKHTGMSSPRGEH